MQWAVGVALLTTAAVVAGRQHGSNLFFVGGGTSAGPATLRLAAFETALRALRGGAETSAGLDPQLQRLVDWAGAWQAASGGRIDTLVGASQKLLLFGEAGGVGARRDLLADAALAERAHAAELLDVSRFRLAEADMAVLSGLT